FRAIASHPDRRCAFVCPRETRTHAIQFHGFSAVERAENAHELFEIFERRGLLTEDTARAVAAADAKLHAAPGKNVERGKEARRDGHVPNGWIGDAGSESHFFRVRSHQCEQWK